MATSNDFDETVKTEPTPKKVTKEEPREEARPSLVLSHTDAYIHDRMKSQPKTLEEVDVQVVEETKDPQKHQLSLPDELIPYGEKYAFRWVMKNKRAIDYSCDVRGWVLVNRTHFPEVAVKARHLFTINGAIERGDVILAFMPIAKAEAIRREPGQLSSNIIRSQLSKHKDDPRYYKPQDHETGDRVVMI